MSTYTPKRSRRGLRLVIALALATTAAGGVFVYGSSMQRQAAQQPVRQEASPEPTQLALISVVVARVDLPAKTRLAPDAFELRDLSADAVVNNALKSLDAIAGKVLSEPMTAGEQLTPNRLREPQ